MVEYTPKMPDTAILEELPEAENDAPAAPKKENPLILRLTRRAVLFFGLETLALILYYVSGNQQHFLEINIKIILAAMTVSTIALALFCAAGVAESIYYTFSWKRPRFLFRLIPYGLLFVVAVALAVFSRTVDLLSLGW